MDCLPHKSWWIATSRADPKFFVLLNSYKSSKYGFSGNREENQNLYLLGFIAYE